MKDKNISYDDLENKDVVDFKQQIEKSAEKYTKKEVEELEVEYAKGVKDIDRQFEKGLIKETNTYKKNLKNIILNDFKANRGVQSADEYVSSELKKNKDINGKVDFLITEFAFKNRGKWIVYETLSAQENKIKRWVKKGIIDKNLEKELYAKLSLMNKETLPK
jgi:ribosomal protein S20